MSETAAEINANRIPKGTSVVVVHDLGAEAGVVVERTTAVHGETVILYTVEFSDGTRSCWPAFRVHTGSTVTAEPREVLTARALRHSLFACEEQDAPVLVGGPLPVPVTEAPDGVGEVVGMVVGDELPPLPPAEADAKRAVADAIMGEVWAQLDDLSDDTEGVIAEQADGHGSHVAAVLRAFAEDLRLTLIATVDQRYSDFLADAGVPEVTR